MAQGKVTVNNLNLSQSSTNAIERKALFIGVGTKNVDMIIHLNSQSNLDELLGVNNSEIKFNVKAAMINGGENWQAFAAPQNSDYDITKVVQDAMNEGGSPELIVVCTPSSTAAEINALQTQAELIRTQFARRVIFLAATFGIDSDLTTGQTWAEYIKAQADIVKGVLAYRVAAVPLLHGNDVGALAGRLCHSGVSIADSPMRVATGPVLGLGAAFNDKDKMNLNSAVLSALDSARLSCIQQYADYPGTFFGDCNLLDADGGDYQVIEHLRVIDKAARAVRLIAISKIANRSLNSTSASIKANQMAFAKPLREMSKGIVFNGEHFPGDIKPPADDAVTIQWVSKTEVAIYLKLQPYNVPKTITTNIVLDLASE